MAIKHFRPITPGQRKKSTLVNNELTKTAPEKSLLKTLKKNSGRNNLGKITKHVTFLIYFCYLCRRYGANKREIRAI